MHRLALSIIALASTLACSGDNSSGPEPPPTSGIGRFLLQSVGGQILPASVPYCPATCTETSTSRLVFPDTFEIQTGTTQRFKWVVSFADNAEGPLQRIVVVGALTVTNCCLSLFADNHPILPASITMGLFYRHPTTGAYYLNAALPWKSGNALIEFRLARLDQ
jgi:hypothetical protein